MARQRVHNQRAGRGSGSGASWISYSDIMAALVLVFVLFLTYNLYQYNVMMQQKTKELDEQKLIVLMQQNKLVEQEALVIIKQAEVDVATAALAVAQDDLEKAKEDLERQTIILIGQQQELEAAKITLAARENELASMQLILQDRENELKAANDRLLEQQQAFNTQAQRIDSIVGVRTEIIRELTTALSHSNINATIDPSTGDIVLESAVFFESGRYTIKEEGRLLLDTFLPVYLNVLLQPEYADYLGEIIIEGHTDSTGTWLNNMKLSQNRAQTVAEYCWNMSSLTQTQRILLQRIMSSKGRSSNDLVYNEDGTENKDASRRVEFKFSLKDAEMIDEMNRILKGDP